jgi:apolipoprotein N-acyltransferase
VVSNLYRHLRDFFLAPISSLLLVLSFPNFDQGFLAWVGLLPLLIAIHDKSLRYGFFLSLVSGILFFLGIFYWILEVQGYTLFHHGLLAVYLGLYFGLFGLVLKLISKRLSILAAFFAAPFIWVSVEYARSNLSFLALPWGLLAHSQYQYPMVIQIASITGTYGISFLIVLVNAALAAIVLSFRENLQTQRRSNCKIHPARPLPNDRAMVSPLQKRNKGGFEIYKARKIMAVTTALLMIFTLLYGYWDISKPVAGTEIKVSLVQGNIEQAKKWDPRYAQEIMEIYTRLTLEASKDRPAMIIWPETATPGSISLDLKINNGVRNIAKEAKTYLLVGSAQHQKFLEEEALKLKYSNSAYLIHPNPEMVRNQRYDKIRLFPFGEYLPFKEIIPWPFINVRDSGAYMPGTEFTIFKLSFWSDDLLGECLSRSIPAVRQERGSGHGQYHK